MEKLKHVYFLVSTRDDKVRVGSVRKMGLRDRLLAYKSDSRRGDDVVSRWIREVGEDSLRIVPMVSTFGDSLTVRRLEQDFIERYGCELNPIRAYAPPGSLREYNRTYRVRNREKRRETCRAYREKNREAIALPNKSWRERNREVISTRFAERVVCDCGRSVRKGGLVKHLGSNIHSRWMLKERVL